jgi:hypothetical protein
MLGIYPGRLDTAEVFLNPNKHAKPGGAIVVGLGKVGELTPSDLSQTFARAVIEYTLAVAECPDERFTRGKGVLRTATLTSLLISTGAGGLTVQGSVIALLQGAVRARSKLEQSGLDQLVTLNETEFIEVWEDRAIQAVRALGRVQEDLELREQIQYETSVRQGIGGCGRVYYEEDPEWWHRLQIMAKKNGALRFNTLTDCARTAGVSGRDRPHGRAG